ncbi:putative sulfate/molybdate transporter [Halorubrum vacuolatum]|uniref:Molybdate transporter of MFS superfamily protein n=1 Tax=Halorubrum vacuolatum TaxID=63740 RepID=A0A238W322_HALVU|nr:putative sulfate/molybdate transporter [Halorubrum vacuolatum]SNR40898.1 Molybdate transporter of MFS superfamily protein [Halorubrum vacuolatum]
MGIFGDLRDDGRLRFGAGEITGAIGDSITVLPLIIALALLTDISLPHVLFAFGVFQIVWGIKYGLPISVEPMKALAALAIAGVLTYAELALAGLILAGVLLTIGLTGTLATVERWIGEPVIRGVQLAVGLLLFETGLQLAQADVFLAGLGVGVALGVILLGYKAASAIVVLAVGGVIAVATAGLPTPQWPGLPPTPPIGDAFTRGMAGGVAAQLAMTIGNAALATSLLFADLFKRNVSPDELSTSMGVTNLFAIPAGGIPMCHGCDGVAGKYEFGARTGGANVVIGGAYLAAAFFATTALLGAFPLAMLGVLLAIVSVSLASHVRNSSNLWLSVGVGLLSLITNLGLAFVLGVLVHLALERGARGV